jgi:tripartite-type tricarboxylate transporter receptor subunit TctC
MWAGDFLHPANRRIRSMLDVSLTPFATQIAALLCALLFSPYPALAETYPTRPITLIVAFAAGGSSDIAARVLGPQLAADLGQSVVIDNRPGAGGNIGVGAVAKAAADGYTIGIAAAGVLAVNPHINRNMGFDPSKDLAPITLLAQIPFLLVSSQTGPGSIAEVVAVAKSDPEKLSIGHGGNGTAMHLTAALFTQKAAVRVPLVAYRGSAPATNDLLGGHIPLAILDIPSSLQLIQDGRLKAIGVSTATRVASLPQVPTFAEQGLEGYESVGWFGLVAPANTPPAIIAKLNAAVVNAMNEPALRERLTTLGAEPSPGTPEAFREFISSESAKWAKVVSEAGIKSE